MEFIVFMIVGMVVVAILRMIFPALNAWITGESNDDEEFNNDENNQE